MSSRIPGAPGAALALLLALLPSGGLAQAPAAPAVSPPAAATERGFKPEQAYDFGEIDNVNLFNGNLTLTIPVGTTYPVGPELSYGLTLVYNSNIWDYEYRDPDGMTSLDCEGAWLAMGYQSACLTKGGPNVLSNAGPGWTLSFGELLQPHHPDPGQPPGVSNPWNRSMRWTYTTADGGSHSFWETLHTGEASSGSGLFTRDGSYLRLQEVGTRMAVDFPNGIRHLFELVDDGTGRWRLQRMEDPFGNFMEVNETPGDPDQWEVTDSHQRTHFIRFEAANHSLSGQRVQQVDLSATGGRRAVFDFTYHPAAGYRPACHDTALGVSQDLFSLELLASVTHTADPADTWTYDFTYFPEDSQPDPNLVQCSAKAARIETLELPTGGMYSWDYRPYGTPVVDCDRPIPGHSPGPHGIFPENPLVANSNLTVTWGVASKVMTDSTGSDLGRVDYRSGGLIFATPSQQCTAPQVWAGVSNIVYREIGNAKVSREESFFSVWASGEDSEDRGWSDDEYGLPIVHSETLERGGQEYALSRKTSSCPMAVRDDPSLEDQCVLYRTHYLRYERSFAGCNPFDPNNVINCSELNHRVAGQLVVYAQDSDRWTASDSSDFDGFGHYRTSTATADFPGLPGSIHPPFPASEDGNLQVSTTRYNPGGGSYSFDPGTGQATSSLDFPLAGEPWLLDTYDERKVQEPGKGSAIERFCFDPQTGFLQGRRTLKGAAASPEDVVTLYLADPAGFPRRELHYGGDLAANAPDECASPPPGAEYRIDHTHAYGVAESSWLVEPDAGAGVACTDSGSYDCILRSLDQTVDPSTGLVVASRDPSGAQTTFAHDTLGRLVSTAPPGRATTEIDYDTPGLWQVSLARRDSGGIALEDERFAYDGIGRLTKVSRSMPNGSRAVRRIQYRPTGWKFRETEFQPASSAAQWTTYTNYDPFGRPGRIEPPDGPAFATTIEYFGIGGERREWSYRAADGTLQQTYRFQRTNPLGRVIRVHQPDPDGGAELQTFYGYDVGGRLSRAHSGVQQRAFDHDNRGFLLAESHPEIGAAGQGTTTYGGYDSRGNAGSRLLASGFDQEYRYDRAGRLTQVLAPGDPLPLKEYVYGRTNGAGNPADRRAGKLVHAKRRNLVPTLGAETGPTADVVVTQTLAYREPGGALTDRELRSSDGRSFHLAMSYDELGNVATLDYPDCLYPSACAAAVPPRQLVHGYRNGYLTSISGYLSDALYHSNGLWSRLDRSNGVSDHQQLYASAAGAHFLSLPGRIHTTGVGQGLDLDLPGYQYDGSRNVTHIGADRFYYDSLNRLVEASLSGAGTRAYDYDRYGNLLALGSDPGRPGPVDPATNRLANAAFSYDAAGNLVTGFGAARTFDGFNMAIEETGTGIHREMLYDAADERVAVIDRQRDEERWTLRGAGNEVLRSVTRQLASGVFSWERDTIFRGTSLVAATVADGSGGEETFHFHLDHLGTTRLKTDGSGDRVAAYKFWPYGERTAATPTDDADTLRFTGHERDFGCAEANCPSTGAQDNLDYMHARYYSPWLGRFLSVDPADRRSAELQPQLWNLYTYALNNPLRLVDPDGQNPAVAGQVQGLVVRKLTSIAARLGSFAQGYATGAADQSRVGIPLAPAPASAREDAFEAGRTLGQHSPPVEGFALSASVAGDLPGEVSGSATVSLTASSQGIESYFSLGAGGSLASDVVPASVSLTGSILLQRPSHGFSTTVTSSGPGGLSATLSGNPLDLNFAALGVRISSELEGPGMTTDYTIPRYLLPTP